MPNLTRADLARLRETHREGKYLSMCARCHGDWPCDVVALIDVAEAAHALMDAEAALDALVDPQTGHYMSDACITASETADDARRALLALLGWAEGAGERE